MGIQISPDSLLGKELRKWNTPNNRLVDGDALPGDPLFGVFGHGAAGYQEYPRMLYRALPTRTGKVVCLQAPPDPLFYDTQPEYDRAAQEVEQFNKRCTLIVKEESQHRRALTDGWRNSVADALDQYEHEQRTIGNLAAERAYTDQRMSPRAQAEMAQAERETHEHLPTLKAPKKRPYRRKVALASAPE